ncbi:MAG TPA: transporter [Gammaproteobacteria bacterium]|nr:transporter [Gammaproteobacteria bacterium]
MTTYIPWWMGALALSSVVTGFWFALGRTLGISGSWARVIAWRESLSVALAEAPYRANPKMLEDALMKATIEHFGEEAVREHLASSHGVDAAAIDLGGTRPKATWTMHLTLLLSLVAGGFLVALFSGNFQPGLGLGELHNQLFGTGMGYFLTLFFGGAMVGFGTQLTGGCSTGHGLSGCARLAPASLVATATFFGTAVIVSFLVDFLSGGGL